MSGPYTTALATLRRCQEGLAGAVSDTERAQLLELHDQALQLLERSAPRRRLSTSALVSRIEQLDRELADRAPAERAATIRERLGISRSRYYELRALAKSG